MADTMNLPGLEQAVECLRRRALAYLIVVFGSHAKGVVRDDSDIDISFAGDVRLNAYEIFLLAQELALLFGRNIDLIDFEQASTVMQAQIVTSGKVVFCIDSVRRQYLFMRALKSYAMLNEERAPILARIAERGGIYAE